MPLAGSDLGLVYESTRTAGRLDHYTVEGSLTGAVPPAGLKSITLEIDVAGRRFQQVFAAAANLNYEFTWDGKDAFGRTVQGAQPAHVKIGYVYDAVYQQPAQFAQSFASFSGVPLFANRARQEITLSQEFDVKLGHFDAEAVGLGGWDLTVHNTYDPVGQVLYLGDGTRQTILSPGFNSVITTIAGTGVSGFSGDGGPATQAQFSTPVGRGIRAGRLPVRQPTPITTASARSTATASSRPSRAPARQDFPATAARRPWPS